MAEINIDGLNVYQKFYLVENDFPINTNGIIGRDFLINNMCKIDYELFTLSLSTEFTEYVLPLKTKVPEVLSIKVPARTEIIHPISIEVKEDSIILNSELQPGVFLANSIISKNGVVHVKILNTTEHDIKLCSIKPEIKYLKDYHVIDKCKIKNIRSQKRMQELLAELNLNNLNDGDRDQIIEICTKYSDIFYLENDVLTVNNFYKQSISLNDTNPVYIKNYRLPHSHLDEINKQVDKLILNDAIEHSTSPYNSPLLVVPKKSAGDDKKFRLVVDFRQINKKIMDDKFPLTRLDDILDGIGRAKYFSTLDLSNSFHQIELEESSRPITAFSTNKGHYQFKRLPFGLKISTNSFQRMLSITLAGLDANAFLYVDDIIIFGCSMKHHNDNLIKVFERLRQYNLKLNPQKCNFLQPEVVYLGHLITANGICTDPKKFDSIKNYPIPKNADESKRFVAFCNYYRRFIKDFASIAKPLNELSKKGYTFEWTDDRQKSFEILKDKLMNPPILQYPDFSKEFIITTDASDFALGAVLSQGEIGKDLPISYASRTLNKHEVKKHILEKELLAIHWAIKFFRPYLYGTRFTVITDHRPLISLFTDKNPSSKMTRVRLDLIDYNFEIKFKPGKLNSNADALSRIKMDTDILSDGNVTIDSDMLKAMMPTSAEIAVITRSMANKNENIIAASKEILKRDSPVQLDQLYTWEATSISDIKNIPKLYFKDVQGQCKKHLIPNNKSKGYRNRSIIHNVSKCNDTCIKCPKDPNNNDNSLPRIIMRGFPKIKREDVTVTVEYSDNPYQDLGLILEKLAFEMHKRKIETIALSSKDELFNFIDKNAFKKFYNKLEYMPGHGNRQTGKKIKNKIKIILYSPPVKIDNSHEMKKLIETYHNSAIGGHNGVKRTINKLKQRFVCKNMNKLVKHYINNCQDCAKNKQTKYTKEPMVITPTPSKSFETIQIDTVGPIKSNSDFKYILTLQCELTKYIAAIPIEDKEARTIAKALVEGFILKYGNFKTLKSDKGSEILNETIRNICIFLGIDHITSTPYHHETIGSIERNHRVLNEYMLAFTKEHNWHEWLPYYVFSYNTTPHADTGYSPFELIYGRLASLPDDKISDDSPIYNYDDYANELKYRLKQAHEKAKIFLDIAKVKRKSNYDSAVNPSNFGVNDRVWLKVGERHKYESPYKGPFKIIAQNGVNSTIQIGNNSKEIHNNRLKLCIETDK